MRKKKESRRRTSQRPNTMDQATYKFAKNSKNRENMLLLMRNLEFPTGNGAKVMSPSCSVSWEVLFPSQPVPRELFNFEFAKNAKNRENMLLLMRNLEFPSGNGAKVMSRSSSVSWEVLFRSQGNFSISSLPKMPKIGKICYCSCATWNSPRATVPK